jgi:hypothetical protein
MEFDIALLVGSTTSAGGFSVSSAIFKDAFAEKGSWTKINRKIEDFKLHSSRQALHYRMNRRKEKHLFFQII